MKKQTLKRFVLSILQHGTAACIMLIVATMMFNSYVVVDSLNGSQTYMVNTYDSGESFEQSELFKKIFDNALSDITRLVVLKEQLETDGVFDSAKNIDVTAYANRKGLGTECAFTAIYQLDDLIKWGRSGIGYYNRPWSFSDFVNYYGPIVNPANFALNEYGELYFKGFVDTSEAGAVSIADLTPEVIAEIQDPVLLKMCEYNQEYLEELAFSYIVAEVSGGIELSREDDGTLMVYLTTFNCPYETVDGHKQLLTCTNNWVDYMKLQNNLVETIISLTESYEQYQACNPLYEEGKSNLKYAVRMMTESGLCTYTNLSALETAKESDITEYFTEYKSYFIYYPDSLEFYGNTSTTQDEIYNYMRQYEYAYPETTHIWIGVDTNYPIEEDAFYNANSVFQKIVPNIETIAGILVALFVIWLGIGIYLTVIAGVSYNSEGEKVHFLTGIDHIWTEVAIVLIFAFVYLAIVVFRQLTLIAYNTSTVTFDAMDLIGSTEFYRYSVFALYGVAVSFFANLFWYSFVRRFRKANLWKGSFIYFLWNKLSEGIDFVMSHGNSAISTLIPYNFFLLVNLVGVICIYMFGSNRYVILVVLVLMVIFDGAIGVLLFKNAAERRDIIEGIRKIRDGEVEYKIDVEPLHGNNREMADAVNNIGEGIRKAVRTSMKDEQMKTDLITNVSHDIKTPLTSIISYVDLLKRLKIDTEPAKSYIGILDTKSQRLKQLTDDLVEASKISSGNIELKKEVINLTELLNQAVGEFSEKFEEKSLQVIFSGSNLQADIFADSRRMWRVIENLFNNICKYALENTRVYIDLTKEEGNVEVSIKNISEIQMNIHADELTERFIRGDSSRTTEGSGLGLSIAKSLTEVQGGSFVIHLDGDLFKVVIGFPEYKLPDIEDTIVIEKAP